MEAGRVQAVAVVVFVLAGVLLEALGAPGWVFLLALVVFAFGAWRFVMGGVRRDVGGSTASGRRRRS